MKNSQPSFWEVPRYKLSTGSNPDLCKKCHSTIWRLICQSGFKTELDTNRLNSDDQVDCYLAKIPTYEIHRADESFIAIYRTKIRMLATKPETIVLKSHQCTKSPNTTWPDYWSKSQTTIFDRIPF